MFIQFATSDPAQARRYLDDPRCVPLPDEGKDIIVTLVRGGAVRVQDPAMHPAVGVVPERELTEAEQAQIARVAVLLSAATGEADNRD